MLVQRGKIAAKNNYFSFTVSTAVDWNKSFIILQNSYSIPVRVESVSGNVVNCYGGFGNPNYANAEGAVYWQVVTFA